MFFKIDMLKSYLHLLALLALSLTACKEPSPVIPSEPWPPEMEGWTIEKVADLPIEAHPNILFFDEADAIIYKEGIWFSEDGGKNWEDRSPQPGMTVDVVFFHNVNEGTISYHKGNGLDVPFEIYIAQTNDAGRNWNIHQNQSFTAPLHYICMLDSFDGFAFGIEVSLGIFQTYDRGVSWERIEGVAPKFISPIHTDNQVIQFVDKTYGYIFGENGEGWYKTFDGGASWGYEPLDVFKARSFQLMNRDTSYFKAERLYKTVNGGADATFVGQEIMEMFIATDDGQILGTERVAEDLSNLSEPIYYFRLHWQDAQGNLANSQTIANQYFIDFEQVKPNVFFALSTHIYNESQTIYRLQKN